MTTTPGVISSPNHPADYPHNLDKTEYVEVETGKILRLEFTAFAVWVCGDIDTCFCDFVRITDGDGTTLMDNSCGHSKPQIITTKTNKVEIYFHTDERRTSNGWSLRWRAVEEGECYHRVDFSSQDLHPKMKTIPLPSQSLGIH